MSIKIPKFLKKKTDCIYCGKEFSLYEVLFVCEADADDIDVEKIDEVNRKFMQEFTYKGDARKYRICKAEDWIEYARKNWKDFEYAISEQKFVVDDSVFSIEEQVVASNELEDITGLDEERPAQRDIISNSTAVLCPHCHCRLPDYFDRYKKIRIGLYGGKRSGKTAFMVTSTYMMQQGFAGATAAVQGESKKPYDILLEQARDTEGLKSTPNGKVFPIIVLVTPGNNTDRQPFFLVLQDIPGEYTQEENLHLLSTNNTFLNQCAFLAMVDINIFVLTKYRRQLYNNTNQINANKREINELENEIAKLEEEEKIGELNKKVTELQERINQMERKNREIEEKIHHQSFDRTYGDLRFSSLMKDINSVQIVFTKVDQWIESVDEEPERKAFFNELFRMNTENLPWTNNGAIDSEILRRSKKNIQQYFESHRMDGIPTNPMGTLLGNFRKAEIEYNAYCAIACPPGVNMGNDSKNVLDPILNICVWEDLLPSKTTTKKRRLF